MMTKEYRRINKQEAAHHSDKFCFLMISIYLVILIMLLHRFEVTLYFFKIHVLIWNKRRKFDEAVKCKQNI